MEIAKLPCGLEVDLDRGDCCMRSCPDKAKRHCDTRRPYNAIERCYNKLKAKEYLDKANHQTGDMALDYLRMVCRLINHKWIKHDSGYCECARCHEWKRDKPDEEAPDCKE